jgi:hypothetical protein
MSSKVKRDASRAVEQSVSDDCVAYFGAPKEEALQALKPLGLEDWTTEEDGSLDVWGTQVDDATGAPMTWRVNVKLA